MEANRAKLDSPKLERSGVRPNRTNARHDQDVSEAVGPAASKDEGRLGISHGPREGGDAHISTGRPGRGLGSGLRGLVSRLSWPESSTVACFTPYGFASAVGFCRLAVAVISFLRFCSFALGLLAGAAVSCWCLVARVRHTSAAFLI